MQTDYKNCDIVYILKEGIVPEELKYSLRSVDQQFPHRKVWFVGAQPEGLYPDARLEHRQFGSNKWERVRSSYNQIILNPEISETFFLFNDDFFVLQRPRLTFINFVDGTLTHRTNELRKNLGTDSSYSRNLEKLNTELKLKGMDTLNFALHLPILLDKSLVKYTLLTFPENPMFRSAYGNLNDVPYMSHKDVKIYDYNSVPGEDWDYVSTTEESFAKGKVGECIRNKFPDPCRYEGPYQKNIKERYTEEGDIIYHVG